VLVFARWFSHLALAFGCSLRLPFSFPVRQRQHFLFFLFSSPGRCHQSSCIWISRPYALFSSPSVVPISLMDSSLVSSITCIAKHISFVNSSVPELLSHRLPFRIESLALCVSHISVQIVAILLISHAFLHNFPSLVVQHPLMARFLEPSPRIFIHLLTFANSVPSTNCALCPRLVPLLNWPPISPCLSGTHISLRYEVASSPAILAPIDHKSIMTYPLLICFISFLIFFIIFSIPPKPSRPPKKGSSEKGSPPKKDEGRPYNSKPCCRYPFAWRTCRILPSCDQPCDRNRRKRPFEQFSGNREGLGVLALLSSKSFPFDS